MTIVIILAAFIGFQVGKHTAEQEQHNRSLNAYRNALKAKLHEQRS